MTATTTASIGKIITSGAVLGLELAHGLSKDIEPARFARLAAGAGGAVNANHPAFVYGHLCIYPAMNAETLGLDASQCAAPPGWDELFKHGVECLDDPDGSIYPSKDEIMRVFKSGHEWLVGQIGGLDDAALNRANPFEQMAERFATVGAMNNFLLNGHLMFHLGQVSTWRRCEGLGGVM